MRSGQIMRSLYPEPETHEGQMGWETIPAASVAGADSPGYFGIVKADGKRQFRSVYVEIPKKNGSRNWQLPLLCIFSMGMERPVRKYMAAPMTGVRRLSFLMWQSGWWRNVRRF